MSYAVGGLLSDMTLVVAEATARLPTYEWGHFLLFMDQFEKDQKLFEQEIKREKEIRKMRWLEKQATALLKKNNKSKGLKYVNYYKGI